MNPTELHQYIDLLPDWFKDIALFYGVAGTFFIGLCSKLSKVLPPPHEWAWESSRRAYTMIYNTIQRVSFAGRHQWKCGAPDKKEKEP